MTSFNVDGTIAKALGRVRGPVFLARRTEQKGRPLLSLHTTERRAARTILQQAQAALATDGIDSACTVVVHRAAALNRARSLEGLLKRLGEGEVVYDPTHFIGRSNVIQELAKRLRKALPAAIDSLFVDAGRRALFVVVDRGHYPTDGDERLVARSQTLEQIAAVFGEWQAAEQPDFELAIRVGFEPPSGAKLIAVDRATAGNMLRSLVRRNALRTASASLLGIGVAVPAVAQEAWTPEPSLTIVTQGALYNPNFFSQSAWASIGLKGTVPIGDQYGIMGEASVGTSSYLGAAGHLYWRDPNKGLLSAFASYETSTGGTRQRIGAEGHLYFNTLSLKGIAGYQQSAAEGNGFVGKLDLTFYATPDFSVTAGAGTDPLGTFAHAGFEWQPAMMGAYDMSVFVDGRLGSSQQTRLMGGLKLYFGGAGKSLMDRQRMNSPDQALGSPIAKSPVTTSAYPA